MNLVAEYCTGAAVFSGGKILAVGTPKEIFSDVKLIKQSGLDLPLTASLTEGLKARGVAADNDYTADGFVESVCRALNIGGKER